VKLIVGLGNPGLIYKDSRHNIGFQVVRSLAKDFKAALKRDNNAHSLSGKINLDAENLILALPLTFMNLSGIAVAALLKKHKIDISSLLVVCDDLDLELGRLKLRPAGSSAGQKGLKSIIDSLNSGEFARLRIGIGRPPANKPASEYVLSQFKRAEKAKIKDITEKAKQCCLTWASKGIAESMNIFNAKTPGHKGLAGVR
jgi:PTH1 family peptidyl-tRNA hydrolase